MYTYIYCIKVIHLEGTAMIRRILLGHSHGVILLYKPPFTPRLGPRLGSRNGLIYTWNPFVLCFRGWTLQNKAFSNQNNGSRYIKHHILCLFPSTFWLTNNEVVFCSTVHVFVARLDMFGEPTPHDGMWLELAQRGCSMQRWDFRHSKYEKTGP